MCGDALLLGLRGGMVGGGGKCRGYLPFPRAGFLYWGMASGGGIQGGIGRSRTHLRPIPSPDLCCTTTDTSGHRTSGNGWPSAVDWIVCDCVPGPVRAGETRRVWGFVDLSETPEKIKIKNGLSKTKQVSLKKRSKNYRPRLSWYTSPPPPSLLGTYLSVRHGPPGDRETQNGNCD